MDYLISVHWIIDWQLNACKVIGASGSCDQSLKPIFFPPEDTFSLQHVCNFHYGYYEIFYQLDGSHFFAVWLYVGWGSEMKIPVATWNLTLLITF